MHEKLIYFQNSLMPLHMCCCVVQSNKIEITEAFQFLISHIGYLATNEVTQIFLSDASGRRDYKMPSVCGRHYTKTSLYPHYFCS